MIIRVKTNSSYTLNFYVYKDAPTGTRLSSMGDRAKAAMSDAVFDVVEKLTEFLLSKGYKIIC